MFTSGQLPRLVVALGLGACAPVPEVVAPTEARPGDPPPRCTEQAAQTLPASVPGPAPPPLLASPCPSCSPPPGPELPAPTGTIAVRTRARPIRVHFMGADEPHRDCMAHSWVVRTVPAGVDPVAFAVRAVILGPTQFEAEQGLRSPFAASSNDPRVPPLSASGVRVKVEDGAAIVDFPAAAAPYLDQAACARMAVASSIRFTLLHFREIHGVGFMLAGAPEGEGDA